MHRESQSGLRNLLHRLFAWLWRAQRAEFTYPRTMDKLDRVLIILPRRLDAVKLVRRWRERIIFAAGKRKIVPLSLAVPLEFLEEWSDEHLFFTDADVNSMGIASKRIIDAVKEGDFKLAIDLSPDFDFVTAQVPLRAKIPARIGIANEKTTRIGEKYFNILLCRSRQLDYENIAKLIGAGRL